MAANYDALQPGALRNGLVYFRIALANGLAVEDGLIYTSALDTFPKKLLYVVRDVVMTPSEYGSGLVSGRREWTTENTR